MNNTYIETMYNHGEKPIQNRHDEDPLINIANKPIFGYELGHFNSGETIIYQIIAYDYANNNIKSNETKIIAKILKDIINEIAFKDGIELIKKK